MKNPSSSSWLAAIAILVALVIGGHAMKRLWSGPHFKPHTLPETVEDVVGDRVRSTPSSPPALSVNSGLGAPVAIVPPRPHMTREQLIALSIKWRQATTKLEDLVKCFDEGDCPFDDSDVRSYDRALQASMIEQLRVILDLATRYQAENGGTLAPEAQSVARYFVVHGGDEVKAVAADILALAPLNDENFEALAKASQRTGDPDLLDKFLDVFKRGKGDRRVSHFMMRMIRRSSPEAANEFAMRSLEHITRDNIDQFKALRDALPHRTERYRYVKANIEEKEMQFRGG